MCARRTMRCRYDLTRHLRFRALLLATKGAAPCTADANMYSHMRVPVTFQVSHFAVRTLLFSSSPFFPNTLISKPSVSRAERKHRRAHTHTHMHTTYATPSHRQRNAREEDAFSHSLCNTFRVNERETDESVFFVSSSVSLC